MMALACAAGLCMTAPGAQAEPIFGVDMECYAPAGDPAPSSPEWSRRDAKTMQCATHRNRDQQTNRAFGYGNLTQGGALYVQQLVDQATDPAHPRGGLTTLVPGSKAADPFRTVRRWTEAGLGRVAPVSFKALNGATLRGHVFAPPASYPRPRDGFPGVVITDGSVQAYEELYFWAAQDLASNGYVVMTYDVQGQGDSDLAGADCPGACSGIPYQQNLNFFQGAEDSLDFFVGGGNPFADLLDADRVGIAGHSLGASAVSTVGQCDERVKTIVAWDNLRAIQNCNGVTIPAEHRASGDLINTSALAITNDYGFYPTPNRSAPDPQSKTAGFKQVAAAGEDAQIVTLRNATHLAYTYVPLVLPSDQLGERLASYYTLAWFDLQLKGDNSALDRLTSTGTFDNSVDRTSIGTGSYDELAADPAHPYSGNVPYEIEGLSVKEAMSFYYVSAFDVRGRECPDVRKGCETVKTKAKDDKRSLKGRKRRR